MTHTSTTFIIRTQLYAVLNNSTQVTLPTRQTVLSHISNTVSVLNQIPKYQISVPVTIQTEI